MIKKAIITAAGKGTRQYPGTNAVQKELFPLIDTDGMTKPTLQLVVQEAMSAGIEEIAIIVQPGEEQQFIQHFQALTDTEKPSFENKPWGLDQSEKLREMRDAITYIHQTEQHGFGHAVYCAHDWVNDDPVMLMLGDHVYLSNSKVSCAMQMQAAFFEYNKTVFGVQQTPAEQLYLFGTLAGEKLDRERMYSIDRIYEKPNAQYARKNLFTPGLAQDHFLTIFGTYILTPILFEILGKNVENNIREGGEIQLTTALAELVEKEGAVGLDVNGERLDMGTPEGYLHTLVSLGKRGPFRHLF